MEPSKERIIVKIWKLGNTDGTGLLLPEAKWTYDMFMSFDGRSHLVGWSAPKLVICEDEPYGDIGDAPSFPHLLPLLLSARGVDLLSDLIADDIELLPVRCDVGDYWFVNVTTVLDCINIEKSSYETFRSGEIMRFCEYWLKDEVMEGHNIFLSSEEKRAAIFVSDAFKERVEECGITGFSFNLVWDSSLGHTIEPLGVIARAKARAAEQAKEKAKAEGKDEPMADEKKSFFEYMGELDAETMDEIQRSCTEAREAFEIGADVSGERLAAQINDAVDAILSQNVDPDAPGLSGASVGLGCLYGEAICEGYGWSWKKFGPDAENTYIGVVSPEQNYCVIPMSYIWKILKGENIGLGGENDNTVLLLFNMLDGMDARPGDEKMIPLQ